MPELTTKGKVLYVNWKKPVYLGGLKSSAVSYEMYKRKHSSVTLTNIYDKNEYNCNSAYTYCNITVSYDDLLNGEVEYFHVSINIKEPMKMCHSTPHTITSKESSIDLTKIVGEYN